MPSNPNHIPIPTEDIASILDQHEQCLQLETHPQNDTSVNPVAPLDQATVNRKVAATRSGRVTRTKGRRDSARGRGRAMRRSKVIGSGHVKHAKSSVLPPNDLRNLLDNRAKQASAGNVAGKDVEKMKCDRSVQILKKIIDSPETRRVRRTRKMETEADEQLLTGVDASIDKFPRKAPVRGAAQDARLDSSRHANEGEVNEGKYSAAHNGGALKRGCLSRPDFPEQPADNGPNKAMAPGVTEVVMEKCSDDAPPTQNNVQAGMYNPWMHGQTQGTHMFPQHMYSPYINAPGNGFAKPNFPMGWMSMYAPAYQAQMAFNQMKGNAITPQLGANFMPRSETQQGAEEGNSRKTAPDVDSVKRTLESARKRPSGQAVNESLAGIIKRRKSVTDNALQPVERKALDETKEKKHSDMQQTPAQPGYVTGRRAVPPRKEYPSGTRPTPAPIRNGIQKQRGRPQNATSVRRDFNQNWRQNSENEGMNQSNGLRDNGSQDVRTQAAAPVADPCQSRPPSIHRGVGSVLQRNAQDQVGTAEASQVSGDQNEDSLNGQGPWIRPATMNGHVPNKNIRKEGPPEGSGMSTLRERRSGAYRNFSSGGRGRGRERRFGNQQRKFTRNGEQEAMQIGLQAGYAYPGSVFGYPGACMPPPQPQYWSGGGRQE